MGLSRGVLSKRKTQPKQAMCEESADDFGMSFSARRRASWQLELNASCVFELMPSELPLPICRQCPLACLRPRFGPARHAVDHLICALLRSLSLRGAPIRNVGASSSESEEEGVIEVREDGPDENAEAVEDFGNKNPIMNFVSVTARAPFPLLA